MPPDLTGWIPQAGAVGLLLTAVWLVLTGKIVPKSLHDEVRQDRDAYRAAAETAIAATVKTAASVDRLTQAVEELTAAQRDLLAKLPIERSPV
jgi:hypothetical protein